MEVRPASGSADPETDPGWTMQGSRTLTKVRLESMCQRFSRWVKRFHASPRLGIMVSNGLHVQHISCYVSTDLTAGMVRLNEVTVMLLFEYQITGLKGSWAAIEHMDQWTIWDLSLDISRPISHLLQGRCRRTRVWLTSQLNTLQVDGKHSWLPFFLLGLLSGTHAWIEADNRCRPPPNLPAVFSSFGWFKWDVTVQVFHLMLSIIFGIWQPQHT